MKKLLSLIALLTMLLGAKAQQQWEDVYTIDYSTYTGFPFYVMYFVPEFDNGCMTDYGAMYRYFSLDNEEGQTSDVIVKTQTGDEYYKVALESPGWHQYYLADGIPTEIDGSYKVKALVKASENVTINVNMAWGWEDGQSLGTSVTIPQSDEFVEVEWVYSGIGGTSCMLIAQPGTVTATIEWKNVTVSHDVNAIASKPYAVLSDENTKLTFYYDKHKEQNNGMDVNFTDNTLRGWNSSASYITEVVFDPSFANCTTLTSTAWLFWSMGNLTTITGIENLKTDNVTNMHMMFNGCSKLTSLDVSGFKTDNVVGMYGMFSECTGLTSLDLSSFNTANATNMGYMFFSNVGLKTIYVGNGWSTNSVTSSDDMFTGCTALVGGEGTTYDASHVDAGYAHIDEGPSNPGYLTLKGGYVEAPTFTWNADELTMTSGTEGATIYYTLSDAEELIPATYFESTVASGIPEGFIVHYSDEDRVAPNTYSAGPRMMTYNEGGDFTRALYFREGYVLYGTAEGYGLSMKAGNKYNIQFNTMMWKDNGKYMKFEVIDEADNVLYSEIIENEKNIDGATDVVVSDSKKVLVNFTPEADGNYKLKWTAIDADGNQAFNEVMLAKVTVNSVNYIIPATQYTAPITVTSDVLIEAYAEKDGMARSMTTTLNYPYTVWKALVSAIADAQNVLAQATTNDNVTAEQRDSLVNFINTAQGMYEARIDSAAAITQFTTDLTTLTETVRQAVEAVAEPYAVLSVGGLRKKWDFREGFSSSTINALKGDQEEFGDNKYWRNFEGDATKADEQHFWCASKDAKNADGYACTHNGGQEKIISELEGLTLGFTAAKKFVITYNGATYPNEFESEGGPALGEPIPHGNSYLWLNGKNETIKFQAEVNQTIKIGIESHAVNSAKLGEARGISLTTSVGSLELKEGTPVSTYYSECEWELTGVEGEVAELTIKTTNGCHIYYIIVGDGDNSQTTNTINDMTLTFYYDKKKTERNGMSVGPFDNSYYDQSWYDNREKITNVVFDDSFSSCTSITSTANWFYFCYNLTTITGIGNLKTDNVTNMSGMFYSCSRLTELDVTGFKTDRVKDMSTMFASCSGLTSLDVKGFKTDSVTNMHYMFANCHGLSNIDLSGFNTESVTDMSGMFFADDMSSLDLSSFNTSNVTNMSGMFQLDLKLRTIYVGDGWTTSSVNSSNNMFMDSGGIVGGRGTKYNSSYTDHTYARIDEGPSNPGYFTRSGDNPYGIVDLVNNGDMEGDDVSSYFVKIDKGDINPAVITDGVGVNNSRGIKVEASARVSEDYDNQFWVRSNKPISEGSKIRVSFDYRADQDASVGVECHAEPSDYIYWSMFEESLSFETDWKHFEYENEVSSNKSSDEKPLHSFAFDLSKLENANNYYFDNIKFEVVLEDQCPKPTFTKNDDTLSIQSPFNATIYYTTDGSEPTTNSDVYSVPLLLSMNATVKAIAVVDGCEHSPVAIYEFVAVPEPYAVLSDNNTVLTFYNDTKKKDRNGMSVGPFGYGGAREWYYYLENLTEVVFDESFANYYPTSTAYWFEGCTSLTSITGIENLKTDSVTSMWGMFENCSKLTNLDVSGFKTDNVTNLCQVFYGCSLLTVLDMSGFKTDRVTDMVGLFYNCSGLTTIYVGDGWSTQAVTLDDGMFSFCYNLVGGQGTVYNGNHTDVAYAHIDGGASNPGYLTLALSMGDANGDGSINIADAVATVTNILGQPTDGNFYKYAADMNNDSFIDIFDVTMIVNAVFDANTPAPAFTRGNIDHVSAEAIRLMADAHHVYMGVEQAQQYTAFQFDIDLPEGTELADVRLSGNTDHQLSFVKRGENQYRVVALSMNNEVFRPTNGHLIQLQVSNMAGEDQVKVSNMLFVTPAGKTITGISDCLNATMTNDDAIYNLQGEKLGKSKQQLGKGIYIINHKKVIIK